MRKVTIVKGKDLEVKAFNLDDFTVKTETSSTRSPVGKKELKVLAKELSLEYNDKNIAFAKKLLNAYIKKNA